MDILLRDYLKLADQTHDFVEKFGLTIPVEQLESKIHSLQVGIKNIQAVAKRMADISNIANRVLLHRNKSRSKSYVDPYPTQYDHAVLRVKHPECKNTREIARGFVLPIKSVEREADIPVSNLYYVEELKQYAINIEGVVIKGNLANIVEYQKERSARCEYGIECKSFKKHTNCKYYHDPEDYRKLGLSVPDDNTRNYTVGSWLYSRNIRPKTYFTRHVGSLDTLAYDLARLRRIQYHEEINNREGQLIHDLLIYMILHERGLLERYSHWEKNS